ncbi:MAG TPA: Phenylacetic acid catabolic protein [Candidatus Dormibacteraeota bacterium]|nr:Phenylacetic acid catabolic protein [Candidatus Dormibacteraeota bacterium]
MSLSDLVLSLADNKQMLGLRYAEWATRAPSLEADIAAAAMGLDDLGHSRVLYGCLEPLGADPRTPERESDPATIRNLAYFDEPWTEWSQFVAANAILDTAFTVMIEACVNGSVEVLRQRLRKMLMEERYHFLHGRSWLRSGIEPAPLLRAWQEALEFFGPPESRVDGLSMGPLEMQARLEEQLETKAPNLTIHWEIWDPPRRRTMPGSIDAHTFGMLRGLEEKKYAPRPTAV